MVTVARNPLLDGQAPHPLLIVLSGPSGVGKDSLLMRMRELGFAFHFVVTATSRPIRPGERNGFDYHFVTQAEFEAMIADDELLEWAEVYGHYKGIPKHEIREALASGRDVVLRIDVQGAATIRRLVPDAMTIFVAPGSFAELANRLRWRRSESDDEIEQRLAAAAREMQAIDAFDYVVINREDRLDEAAGQIRSIVTAQKHLVHPRRVEL
jgi:guanylate kinase